MADKKISELTALTGANVATDDQLVIVDTSAALTKSITIDEFKNALDTATGFVRITGDTMTGDLSLSGADVTFGDNDKAIFGAGSNLQIYHDGTHNYIEDTSTGNLYIQGTNLILKNQGGTENLADFVSNGAVTLYYDNSPKLATTSTGIDVTGNATFADNGKAIFGAGSDLQIYHDGTRSFIQDVNDGNLILDTFNGNEVNITSGGNAEFMVRAIKDGAVNLYYDNGTYSDPKLATTSTGVNITGVLSSDGLTVDGTTGVTISGAFPMINFGETDTTDENSRVRVSAGDFRIDTVNDAYGSGKTRFLMDNATGDISFYEDTGTSPKFFWDAAAESLGIGTSSPNHKIDVVGSSENLLELTSSGSFGTALNITQNTPSTSILVNSTSTGDIVDLRDNGTTVFTVKDGGNVGIGTSSPSTLLHLDASADGRVARFGSGTSDTGGMYVTHNSGSTRSFELSADNILILDADRSNGRASSRLQFNVDGSERMRIDSSGNVGIGTSSPSGPLEIQANSDARGIRILGRSDDISQIDFLENDASTMMARLQARPTYVNLLTSQATPLLFSTAAVERMRIDSSGNLLVGKTSAVGASTVGVEARPDGDLISTRSSAQPLTLNRTTSDGDIVQFRKDNTTVGSIGIQSGNDLYLLGDDGGLRFQMDSDFIQPCSSSGSDDDNRISLGQVNSRFKDLYLSGGVYLGGTGSANKLEDYEEGTWIPSLTFGGTNTGLTYHTDGGTQGHYTKIGNQVIAHFSVNLQNKGSSTGNVNITGLPFNPANTYYNEQGGFVTYFASLSNIVGTISVYVSNGPNVLLRHMDSATAGTNNTITLTQSNFNSGSRVWGTVIYKTNA